MAFGRKGTTPFFILPGNPRAIRTLYEVFVNRGLLRDGRTEAGNKCTDLPCPRKCDKPRGLINTRAGAPRARAGSHNRACTPRSRTASSCSNRKQDFFPPGTMVRVLEA